MKTPSRRHPAAFTLIELMAVIVIIVILAGIVVGSMGYVNDKQARSKAKVQIDLLSKALEDYKMDNGTYPATGNSNNPAASNTNVLWKALYGDGASDPNKKIYLAELDPNNNKQGWTQNTSGTISIVDPWGNHYRYRTAVNSTGAANAATQNPDFDLWSAGKDGQSDSAPEMSKTKNKDDIRNF